MQPPRLPALIRTPINARSYSTVDVVKGLGRRRRGDGRIAAMKIQSARRLKSHPAPALYESLSLFLTVIVDSRLTVNANVAAGAMFLSTNFQRPPGDRWRHMSNDFFSFAAGQKVGITTVVDRRRQTPNHSLSIVNERSELLMLSGLAAAWQSFTVILTVNPSGISIGGSLLVIRPHGPLRDPSPTIDSCDNRGHHRRGSALVRATTKTGWHRTP